MSEKTHYEKARALLADVPLDLTVPETIAAAQVEATLALVDQVEYLEDRLTDRISDLRDDLCGAIAKGGR